MEAQFGIIGLETMGRNFLLNIADHGIPCVGYDIEAEKREALLKEGQGKPLAVGSDLADFLDKLETPRNIMLFVAAGPIVDQVIADLVPHLGRGDLIMDGADSHFADTERREAELAALGIGFLGVGVSGGAWNARSGPCIMVGGQSEYCARVENTFNTIAAQFNRPCAGYVGTASAGHFARMVHDGIEYAMMQQLAEAYDYMRRVLRMNIVLTQKAFEAWDDEVLASRLMWASKLILRKYDKEARQPMVELIVDSIDQIGMGRWASKAAMDFGVPVPTIDAAVTMRMISANKAAREQIGLLFKAPTNGYNVTTRAQLEDVHDALYCGFVLAFEQGFSLLRAANEAKSFGMDLGEIAGIWGYGSIIWSAVVHEIAKAYTAADKVPSTLLLEKHTSDVLYKNMAGLRKVVSSAALCRLPVMALAASLNYYSAFRTVYLPANLIQAQRDYFFASSYERIDKEGSFHTPDWDVPTY